MILIYIKIFLVVTERVIHTLLFLSSAAATAAASTSSLSSSSLPSSSS
jgi:hypothetical protein